MTNFGGSNNSFFGYSSGLLNTGSDNTFIGNQAGLNNGTGYGNTFLGSYAGHWNDVGYNNTFLGHQTGYNNTTGEKNTFLGYKAGRNNQEGTKLTFLGYEAGYKNTGGFGSTLIGYQAGYNSNAAQSAFLGHQAGYKNTSGGANLFLGHQAGYSNTIGGLNVFLGTLTGYYHDTGSFNTFLGESAGLNNIAGSYNTFLGNKAGYNATGTGNVFLGYHAGYNEILSNKLYIDNSSTSSPLIYGDFFTNALTFNGSLNVTGSLTKGSGTFVQPHPADPSKEVAYAFFEGPEHAVFLRGKAQLVKGRATIKTPEYFRVVAGKDEDITVQFTPRSIDTFGVAAVRVTKDSIEVRELKGGKHTYEFDYFITAKRGGFEGHQPIQPNTHFTANQKTAEDFEQAYAAKDDLTINAMRRLLIANGILTRDGKLNSTTAAKLGWHVQPTRVAATEPQVTQNK